MRLDSMSTRRPQVVVLGQEGVADITEASFRVLDQIGVVIEAKSARQLLEDAGAKVNRRSGLVKIPAQLIQNCLSQVPQTITLSGLTDKDDLVISPNGPRYFRPAIGIDMFLDHITGQRREATAGDLAQWVRLIEVLGNVHISAPLYPQDTPSHIRDLQAVEVTLRHSRKPLVICAYSKENLDWMAELVAAFPRSLTPRISLVFSADSPLSFSENQIDLALSAARRGFPVIVNSGGLAGATSPVTSWGSMIQMNAEALAAVTLVQLAVPGAPIVYDMQPLVFDMKVGCASFGYTELGLLNAAFIELGRSYGLPTESSGLKTDSHLCDEQAGLEKVMTGYLSVISGANLVSGIGSLATASTASLVQLVIDDDIAGQLLRVAEGIPHQADAAEEAIARVGPKGHYLSDEHTLLHFRDEYYLSKTAVRGSYESWQAVGCKGFAERAAERVEALLAKRNKEVIRPGVGEELSRIMREARRALL